MSDKIILPYGYYAEIKPDRDFTIYNSNGYFKMKGFPHRFWDAIYEYGDFENHKWDGEGNPITPNTKKDFNFETLRDIVFHSVKEKLTVRARVLAIYKEKYGK